MASNKREQEVRLSGVPDVQLPRILLDEQL